MRTLKTYFIINLANSFMELLKISEIFKFIFEKKTL